MIKNQRRIGKTTSEKEDFIVETRGNPVRWHSSIVHKILQLISSVPTSSFPGSRGEGLPVALRPVPEGRHNTEVCIDHNVLKPKHDSL